MVRTRLLNLRTLKLEDFEIGMMPPYVAVSHIWTDCLFPPDSVDTLMVAPTEGLQSLRLAVSTRDELYAINYMWVDCWCIDQLDENDKSHQIPCMGSIYKDAVATIITTRSTLSFTQADWDQVTADLREDARWFSSLQRYEPEHTPRVQNVCQSENAINAYKMLVELAKLPWMTRIWTAQEFILARELFLVDHERKLFCFDTDSINKLNFLLANGLQRKVLLDHTANEMNRFVDLNRIRNGLLEPITVMAQASFRQCTRKVDEIYGLMSASGVVISPIVDETIEMAWHRWWEASIQQGHLDWFLVSIIRVPDDSIQHEQWSCAMPPCRNRLQSWDASDFQFFRSARSGAKPWRSVRVVDGAVKIWARCKGRVNIDVCVGDYNTLPKDMTELRNFYQRDPVIVERFLLALSSWYSSKFGVSTILSACEQDPGSVATGYHADAIQEANYMLNLLSSHTPLPPFSFYLGSLETLSGNVDVCLFAANGIPQGDLYALDLDSQPASYTSLMIVQQTNSSKPNSGFHKVGMTAVMMRHNLGMSFQDQSQSYVCLPPDEEPLECFSIGGSTCNFCQSWKKGEAERIDLVSIL